MAPIRPGVNRTVREVQGVRTFGVTDPAGQRARPKHPATVDPRFPPGVYEHRTIEDAERRVPQWADVTPYRSSTSACSFMPSQKVSMAVTISSRRSNETGFTR